MILHSIKMRASKDKMHISGAESIVKEDDIDEAVRLLVKRALSHPKGEADNINIKIERIDKDEIKYIKPLPVTTVDVKNPNEGFDCVKHVLNKLNINDEKAKSIIGMLRNTPNMRGAILLDINTLKRLEPNKERGIRATYMDFENSKLNHLSKDKQYNSHFIEALALASKVISCPQIIGEICYSDDPNYSAGYIASKEYGYIRFPYLKEIGDEKGGRIFLYDSNINNVDDCIEYIEKAKVLIKDDIVYYENIKYEEFLKDI